MSLIHIEWRPTPKEMRKFGISTLIILGLLGVLLQFAPPPAWWGPRPAAALAFYIAAAITGLACIPGWKAGLPVYWAWMGFSFVVGNITNFILLSVFYYLVITPIGLIMRLTGRDKLCLKKPKLESYWRDVEQIADKTRYERQF